MQRIITILFCVMVLASCKPKMYLFTSFHEPANEGLRLLYSKDGYHWKTTDSIYLKPVIGKDKIMRDPSMLQGPDGTFHLVWTTEWKGGNGFGYASSKDLKHWSEQQYIPAMQNEPTVVNVWAPELFYDDVKGEYIIVFASCIPNRFEKGIEDENNNHRLYYTTTKDFKTFSPTALFLDPKFSVIDAVIVKRAAKDYMLVLKDNTRPERNIKVAFANNPLGPWENISKPFTEKFTEGPAVAKVKNGYLIYYDVYQNKKYGASFTNDFKTFVKADSLISVPDGHKHGTILKVNKRVVQQLKN
ncbi:glycoside hydrolase family 43 protein [Ferruginibacter sp.]|nr:glycoside hydrolase family 43 protein [Ferruginibacter sp.]